MATQGVIEGADAPLIDHVAHDRRLAAREVRAWSRFHESGVRMSDHHGALVSLVTNDAGATANASTRA